MEKKHQKAQKVMTSQQPVTADESITRGRGGGACVQQPQSRERVRANAQAGLPSPLRRSPAASRPCGPLGTDKEAEPLALQTGEPCGLLGTCSSCISLPPATDVRTCKCPASSSHREGARRLEAPLTAGGLEAEQRGRGQGDGDSCRKSVWGAQAEGTACARGAPPH